MSTLTFSPVVMNSGTKPATLETGHQIAVPLFITSGEKVKVDTRDSSYLGRVKG